MVPHPDIERVLLDRQTIARRVEGMAADISRDYSLGQLLVVGVLKGSFIFMADLIRAIALPCEVDFITVSSYGKNATTTGSVRILKDLDCDIGGRDVIIVEDILDSGTTLGYIMNVMEARHPSSLAICTLLDKPERRRVTVDARYVGFRTPDEFLVGYGLDYAGRYRNLPYIGILKREIYSCK